ncbi:unnamed protein product [Linum tenue]|uniref:C2H2-type domain-containing protein n=1 Tax=Linum tenue TaxID=586396 RepID=A0AAV0MAX1_9ROSI|nr:unnamed protein product [Linum tenue]
MQESGAGGGPDVTLTMANCLMLLSQATTNRYDVGGVNFNSTSPDPSRVFECKTCNRQFPSFQALGGHRASHKKRSPASPGSCYDVVSSSSSAKPKTHECSICGLEFSIGQALGGHMRRHRGGSRAGGSSSESYESRGAPPRKRGRVLMMVGLDLNLTPYENDARMFELGKAGANNYSPMVDCFY